MAAGRRWMLSSNLVAAAILLIVLAALAILTG